MLHFTLLPKSKGFVLSPPCLQIKPIVIQLFATKKG